MIAQAGRAQGKDSITRAGHRCLLETVVAVEGLELTKVSPLGFDSSRRKSARRATLRLTPSGHALEASSLTTDGEAHA